MVLFRFGWCFLSCKHLKIVECVVFSLMEWFEMKNWVFTYWSGWTFFGITSVKSWVVSLGTQLQGFYSSFRHSGWYLGRYSLDQDEVWGWVVRDVGGTSSELVILKLFDWQTWCFFLILHGVSRWLCRGLYYFIGGVSCSSN